MHFLNVHHCYDSVGRLIRALGGESPDEASIHTAYREAITQVRPVAPPATGITVSYEDGDWGRHLLDARVFEDIFVGIGESSPEERDQWARQVTDAVTYIRSLNSDLGRIIDLLVTDVVVLNSERTGGGSASHLPGLVCLSPGPHWQMVDFAESIMHEGTHLNLFAADSVHGIYTLPTSVLAEDRYRVLSAVKVGERRPLDKAFHSAAVAVPLMYLQQLRGQTALVDQFAGSLLECADGLLDQAGVFTDYGRLLISELHRFAQTTDFDYVVKSVSSTEYAHY